MYIHEFVLFQWFSSFFFLLKKGSTIWTWRLAGANDLYQVNIYLYRFINFLFFNMKTKGFNSYTHLGIVLIIITQFFKF